MDSLYLREKILDIKNSQDNYTQLVSELFNHQYQNNPLYRKFCDQLNYISQNQIFMPIGFFKSHKIMTGVWETQHIFESSGTTGRQTSRHHVRSLDFYNQITIEIFESQYGPLEGRPILALLPSYLERSNSSLVFMVEHFIRQSRHPASKFYKYDFDSLVQDIIKLKERGGILIGVTYALLDLADRYKIDLSDWIILETGGMKGKRAEMTRGELHEILNKAFNTQTIHSEYGMTELLSQAYSQHGGVFEENPFMKITIRAIDDPFEDCNIGKLGRICITDFANLDSISFIATDDLGRKIAPGKFTVEGRIDHSDLRGCNLLYH